MSSQNNAIAAMNNLSQGLAGIVAPLVNNGDYLNIFNMMMWDENRQLKNRPKYNMKAQKEIAEMQVFFRGNVRRSFIQTNLIFLGKTILQHLHTKV